MGADHLRACRKCTYWILGLTIVLYVFSIPISVKQQATGIGTEEFPSVSPSTYLVVERIDSYATVDGKPASIQAFDHEVVHFILEHTNHRIYAECDLSTLNKLAPEASCGLRPLRGYKCVVPSGEILKAKLPLSDLICTDGDGRDVYLYVTKQE